MNETRVTSETMKIPGKQPAKKGNKGRAGEKTKPAACIEKRQAGQGHEMPRPARFQLFRRRSDQESTRWALASSRMDRQKSSREELKKCSVMLCRDAARLTTKLSFAQFRHIRRAASRHISQSTCAASDHPCPGMGAPLQHALVCTWHPR